MTAGRLAEARSPLVAALAATLALAVLLAGCGGDAPVEGRMKVSATTTPLADFSKNVGGDLVEVQTLIPAGANPHTFEPTAGQLTFLSDSRVMVINGLELEEWVSDVIGKVGPDDMTVVVTAEAIPPDRLLPAGAYHGEEGSHEHAHDPHVWLEPTLAMYQVDAIRDGFTEADPENGEQYAANAAAYKRKLAALDREIAESTSKFTRKNFVALHPAWAYFSRRYGVNQAGAIEEVPEQEPSGKQVAEIVERIREMDINVIFAEPQTSAKAAEVIAAELPGVRVMFLDPFGDPKKPGVSTYIETMRHNVSVMAEALR